MVVKDSFFGEMRFELINDGARLWAFQKERTLKAKSLRVGRETSTAEDQGAEEEKGREVWDATEKVGRVQIVWIVMGQVEFKIYI